jgi:hypothetical protein
MPTLTPPRIKKAGAGRPHKIPEVKVGRPLAITPELENTLLQKIREGIPINDACTIAGISRGTYQRYLANGKAEESGYFRELYERIMRAQAEYRAELVGKLHTVSATDPKAIMAILERRDRANWAPPKQALEVEGELKGGGQTIIVIQSAVPRSEKPVDKPLTLEDRRVKMLGSGEVSQSD